MGRLHSTQLTPASLLSCATEECEQWTDEMSYKDEGKKK